MRRIITKPVDWLGNPRRAALTILVLALILVATLGFSIRQYNQINTVQHQDSLARQAAVESCLSSKPKFTKLLTSLETTYGNQATTAKKVYKATPKSSKFYAPRKAAYYNYQKLVDALQSFLPIVCQSSKPQESNGR